MKCNPTHNVDLGLNHVDSDFYLWALDLRSPRPECKPHTASESAENPTTI